MLEVTLWLCTVYVVPTFPSQTLSCPSLVCGTSPSEWPQCPRPPAEIPWQMKCSDWVLYSIYSRTIFLSKQHFPEEELSGTWVGVPLRNLDSICWSWLMLRASQILSPVPSCCGSVFAMLRLTAMLTTADFSLSAQVCSILERGAETGADRGNVTEEVRQWPPIHYYISCVFWLQTEHWPASPWKKREVSGTLLCVSAVSSIMRWWSSDSLGALAGSCQLLQLPAASY